MAKKKRGWIWVLAYLVLLIFWELWAYHATAFGAAFRWYDAIRLPETADSVRTIAFHGFDSTATSVGTSLDSIYWKWLTNDTSANELWHLVYWNGYTQPQSYYEALYNTWYSDGDTVEWALRSAWADSPDSVIRMIVTNWTDTTFDTLTDTSQWYDTLSLTDTSTCLVTFHTLISGDWSSVTYTFPKATAWSDCVGDPSDSNFCLVYGTVVAAGGDSLGMAKVTFQAPGNKNTCDNTIITDKQVTVWTENVNGSHHKGYFQTYLLRSSCCGGNQKYQMSIEFGDYNEKIKDVIVPDSASYHVWP